MKVATTKQRGPQVNCSQRDVSFGPAIGSREDKVLAEEGGTNRSNGLHTKHKRIRSEISRIRERVFLPQLS